MVHIRSPSTCSKLHFNCMHFVYNSIINNFYFITIGLFQLSLKNYLIRFFFNCVYSRVRVEARIYTTLSKQIKSLINVSHTFSDIKLKICNLIVYLSVRVISSTKNEKGCNQSIHMLTTFLFYLASLKQFARLINQINSLKLVAMSAENRLRKQLATRYSYVYI